MDESPFKGFHYGMHVKGHVKKKKKIKKSSKFFASFLQWLNVLWQELAAQPNFLMKVQLQAMLYAYM